MNNQEEIAFNEHIRRLSKDISTREAGNPWHNELTKIDARNIASLREGRIPEYGDHCVWGQGLKMFEFENLERYKQYVN